MFRSRETNNLSTYFYFILNINIMEQLYYLLKDYVKFIKELELHLDKLVSDVSRSNLDYKYNNYSKKKYKITKRKPYWFRIRSNPYRR